MNKKKFLHRKGGHTKKWQFKQNYGKHNYGKELPFRESIRNTHKKNGMYYWGWKDGIDFTPAGNYIDENINHNWDDIYSNLIKKTKQKNRWLLENFLSYYIHNVKIFDYIPYIGQFGSNSKLAIGWLFVDEDNIIRKYNSEEEILSMAKSKLRRDKILKLMELIKEEESI